MSLTAQLINFAALLGAALILWRTEPALARMTGKTHWMIRYAMLMLAGGAIGIIFIIFSGSSVDFFTLLILSGVALLIFCERHRRHLIHPKQKGIHHAS
jgi:hypothetical protein